MENYEFVKDIGSGSFGLAKLMRNKTTQELVAMKFIERGHRTNENVAKEIINHRSLRHPNIVRFKEVLLTRTHLVIVMEYAAGGELYERAINEGRFIEDEARYFFQQLISGVSYCHFMQISHGDLKLANILLDGSHAPRLKICDFGYSTSDLLHSKPKSIAGTLRYIAPEVLSGTEYDGKLADVWSCGVTLYVMLFAAYPFEDGKEPENFEKTTQRILGAQYEIPAYVHISEECRQFLSHIFVAPARRITIEEIKKHPWFLKNLARELTAATQAIYYNRSSPAFSLQSVEDIMEIVTEAAKPAMNPPPVSNSIGGFRWAKEENDDDQEENVELEVDKEQEYEVAEEDEYDKIVKVAYEDKRVKEVYKSKSLSVFDVVRSAERSLVPNQFHSDYTDPSPLAATSFDQSMFGLRLAERSVCYPEKATNSKLLDSLIYVHSAERSLSASQSSSSAGNYTNSKLSYPSISDVRSSEKSIKSNVSHPSKPWAYQRQSLGFASEPLDSKSWTQVTSVDPSMSDVRPAEKSIVLNQLHSYHFVRSASKLHTEGPTEGSIDSKALDSNYSAQIGNFDLSISDVRSAEKSSVLRLLN